MDPRDPRGSGLLRVLNCDVQDALRHRHLVHDFFRRFSK
jgi:hypothetical protein